MTSAPRLGDAGPAGPDATTDAAARFHVALRDRYDIRECALHPGDAPSSGLRAGPIAMRVAIVTSGLFRHRAPSRLALLGPGAMLVGRAVEERDLEPIDADGGTVLAFEYADRYCAEPGLQCLREQVDACPDSACLPASKKSVRVTALAARMAREARRSDADAIALAVMETASLAAKEAPAWTSVAPELEARITRALRYVDRHHGDDCSLDALAAEAGLGVFHFLRSFKRCVGQTPCQHVMAMRLQVASDLIASSDARVLDIAIQSGFGDLSHFNASFREAFGVQPSAYRKLHRFERIAA
jgi:AraC family transcriptional regulator